MSAAREASAPPPPPKQDPESLVLRGRPRRVVRFRRGVIIGSTAAVAAAIVVAAWLALEPQSFRFAVNPEEARPAAARPPDAVAGAPATYSDVPKLGPPLPGDLGRAIVEHEQSLAPAADSSGGAPGTETAARAAAEEQQMRASEEQAARTSGVLAQLSNPARGPVTPAAAPGIGAASEAAPEAAVPDGAQEHKVAFVTPRIGNVVAGPAMKPPSQWMLRPGTVIPASLITGLNSDLPGLVVAQVTENVRDSVTGRTVLIPQGARLIGHYDSSVAYGQRRALLVWDRILFANGASVELDKMPATDSAGYAGLEGRVNSHPWQLLKGVVLSSVLGLGSDLSFGGSGIARAIRESAQQNASQAGDQLVRKSLDIQPTLTVPPGWPVRVLVDRDIILEPWRD